MTSITSSELVFLFAKNRGSLALNGGVPSHNIVPSNIKNAVFKDATSTERVAGRVDATKMFAAVHNLSDTPLLNSKLFVDYDTIGDDVVYLVPATIDDTEQDLIDNASGSYDEKYGIGVLTVFHSMYNIGVSVLLKDPALFQFKAGDIIRVSDKDFVGSINGFEEYLEVASVDGWLGNEQNLTVTSSLRNDYPIGTKVSRVLPTAAIVGGVSNVWVSNAIGSTGSFDHTPLVVGSKGGSFQKFTFTFGSDLNFDCTAEDDGYIGSGTVDVDFKPLNVAVGGHYFTLPPACWVGALTVGDVIQIITIPVLVPFWAIRVIPPQCPPLLSNVFGIGHDGETA